MIVRATSPPSPAKRRHSCRVNDRAGVVTSTTSSNVPAPSTNRRKLSITGGIAANPHLLTTYIPPQSDAARAGPSANPRRCTFSIYGGTLQFDDVAEPADLSHLA